MLFKHYCCFRRRGVLEKEGERTDEEIKRKNTSVCVCVWGGGVGGGKFPGRDR